MNTESMYTALGITPAVHRFGEEVLAGLRARFDEIDRVAEYNQCKVIGAMQKNRVDATHFAATTGYGYNDAGRDNLERVYADCFHTEAALVRPQITCGTHALTVHAAAHTAAAVDEALERDVGALTAHGDGVGAALCERRGAHDDAGIGLRGRELREYVAARVRDADGLGRGALAREQDAALRGV